MSRLLRLMGIEAIYPKPRLSRPGAAQQRYPYLLRDVPIQQANNVWSSDITFVRMRRGFLYLVAIFDWYSRYVVSWELSNIARWGIMSRHYGRGFDAGQPKIFNTDQGAEFTSLAFTTRLEAAGIRISWDGRGRALDNVFIERLWRSLKYKEISCTTMTR